MTELSPSEGERLKKCREILGLVATNAEWTRVLQEVRDNGVQTHHGVILLERVGELVQDYVRRKLEKVADCGTRRAMVHDYVTGDAHWIGVGPLPDVPDDAERNDA